MPQSGPRPLRSRKLLRLGRPRRLIAIVIITKTIRLVVIISNNTSSKHNSNDSGNGNNKHSSNDALPRPPVRRHSPQEPTRLGDSKNTV